MGFRLIFVDLDGTLIDHKDIVSPRNRAALSRAQQAGCTVVICTARTRCSVEHIAAQWRGHGYAVLANGAIIAEWDTGRVLRKIALPVDVVQAAARMAHAAGLAPVCEGADADLDGGRALYTDGRCDILPACRVVLSEYLRLCADLETESEIHPVSISVFGSKESTQKLAQRWRTEIGPGVAVFDSRTDRYDCWCAYMHSAEANKARGAATVASMLGVPREEVMAIGDDLNDVQMLTWAGLGVAMGGGHPEALAAADTVTGSQDEDGVHSPSNDLSPADRTCHMVRTAAHPR